MGASEGKGRSSSGRFAALVAAGILLSRLAGLVRDRVFAHYFGLSAEIDAFRAAFRIPNFLQNLFGEGVLSASFIPVYASLLEKGEDEEADRVAGAVFLLLALLVSVIVLTGVLATPFFITAIAGGLQGETRALAVNLTRILFPGAGALVMSAWCLGILNSHRKFFMSYTAPVAWNVVMIGTLLVLGRRMEQRDLAVAVAWASVAGSVLQFCVQLPLVLGLARKLRIGLGLESIHVRTVLKNFVPVFFSRGVVQIIAWVDTQMASYLSTGALAALSNAQTLYLLPVSLFGMSVSAAELPEMSRVAGDDRSAAVALHSRLCSGMRRIAVLVVPSAVAFLFLGDIVVGAIYQSGRFKREEVLYVWAILAGNSIGLLATTLGRLCSSGFYALRDTRTPLKFALARVFLATGGGYLMAFSIPPMLHLEPRYGAVGLAIAAGVAGWVEFLLLRRSLSTRIGSPVGISPMLVLRLWAAALFAAASAWGIKILLGVGHPILLAVVALGLFGGIYFAAALALGVQEVRELLRRLPGPLNGMLGGGGR